MSVHQRLAQRIAQRIEHSHESNRTVHLGVVSGLDPIEIDIVGRSLAISEHDGLLLTQWAAYYDLQYGLAIDDTVVLDHRHGIWLVTDVLSDTSLDGGGGGGGSPTGAAGGVLGGTYPNPSFAVDMATQAELDAAVTVLDAAIALLAPKNSPALTGNPTAPTQAFGDNSTKLATTEFVQDAAVFGSSAKGIYAVAWNRPGGSVYSGDGAGNDYKFAHGLGRIPDNVQITAAPPLVSTNITWNVVAVDGTYVTIRGTNNGSPLSGYVQNVYWEVS